jgi:hypothetical protein
MAGSKANAASAHAARAWVEGLEERRLLNAVALKVVDQDGQEIPGSQVTALSQTVTTGGSLSLPEGTHSFTVIPAAFGGSHPSWLSRTEVVEVTAATTEIAFEWITSEVTLRVVDQGGAEIPGSKLYVDVGTFFRGDSTPEATVLTGGTAVLPITDESVYPTLYTGGHFDGHHFVVAPGSSGSRTFRGSAGSSRTTKLPRPRRSLYLSGSRPKSRSASRTRRGTRLRAHRSPSASAP